MKKKLKVILIVLLLILSTGCTKYVKDGKQNVTYEKTGQTLTANILCKPQEEDLYKIYEENNDELAVKLEELPSCDDFKPNSLKYVSLWESLIVKPLAWIILQFGSIVKNMGVSVMLIGLIIRILYKSSSYKTVIQSENMKKAQPEINKLEKKYKNKTDNESLMMKSQETMLIYKKYKINPISGCLLSFIQLPLFLGFLEAINRVPAIFEDSFLTMNLGMTPLTGIMNKKYIYVILIVLIILSTYFSFKMSMKSQSAGGANVEQQMQYMFLFMIVMISIASFSLPTAIALYWIITNGFAVIQTLVIKKLNEKRK